MRKEAKEEGRQGEVSRYKVPRGNCLHCGRRINAHDYWFWWIRHYHRGCKIEAREVGEK